MLTIAWAYWPALSGPFVLDDLPNFALLQRWLAGDVRWDGAVFGVASGPLHRPVAMASFVLDAWLQGFSPAAFKRTNLLIHLLCAAAVFVLLRRLLARVPALRDKALAAAGWLAFVWALLPLQVSTVAYAVQRMTQLSALFSLLAVIAYVAARRRFDDGRRGGVMLLFGAVPTLTVLATLSKETGALVPLLLLAVEWFWRLTASPEARSTPRAIRVFFVLTIAVPALAALVVVFVKPDVLVGGYADRGFTLIERLLSQPRALWDYVRQILLPNTARMGLVHDAFPLSRTLLSPPTTLLAMVAWLAAIALAWRYARRAPLVALGLAWFLAGHVLESGVVPLEIYFEHRNYLPSLGVLLATTGLVLLLIDVLTRRGVQLRAPSLLVLVVLPLAFLLATHGRAAVWGDADALYAQSLAQNPDSLRLRSQIAAFAMERGDRDEALAQIERAERHATPRSLPAITLWRLVAWCETGGAPPPVLLDELARRATVRIDITSAVAVQLVNERVLDGRCAAVSRERFTQVLQAWLAAPANSAGSGHIARVRYELARLLAVQERLAEAAEVLKQATADSRDVGIVVLLFQLQTTLGDIAGARQTLALLERTVPAWETRVKASLPEFARYLDAQAADGNAPPAG